MTIVGGGGVTIERWCKSKRFHKEYGKLDNEMKNLVDQKLQDLVKEPRPSGLAFEKLKGYADPDVFTIHITGNLIIELPLCARRCIIASRGV